MPHLNEEGYKINEINSLQAIQKHTEDIDRNQQSPQHSALLAVGDVPQNEVPQLIKELETKDAKFPSTDSNEEGYKINEINSLQAIQNHTEDIDRNQQSAQHSSLLAVGDVPQNDVPQLIKELEPKDAKFPSHDSDEESYKINDINSLQAIQKHTEDIDRNQQSAQHSALLAVGDVPQTDVPKLITELETKDVKFPRPDSNEEGSVGVVSLNEVPQLMKELETKDAKFPIPDSSEEGFKINQINSLQAVQKHTEDINRCQQSAQHSALLAVGDNDVPQLIKELETKDAKFPSTDSNEEGYKINEINSLQAIQKHTEDIDRNQQSAQHSALLAVGDVPQTDVPQLIKELETKDTDVPQLIKELETKDAKFPSPDSNEEGYNINEINSLQAIQKHTEDIDTNQQSAQHSALLAVGDVSQNDVPQLIKELETKDAKFPSPDSNEEGYNINEINSLQAIQKHTEDIDRFNKVLNIARLAVSDVPQNEVPQLIKEIERCKVSKPRFK
ncbi:uncharacterized protein LOC126335980 [Schistocerca gregaria]|uniref:uncharacterized protein LOC126335980 n=1 Tax=Schistocerca gregaria TaxID=7010 RepID=UPI00211E6E02|nr:uncharacterized protein LOC126335980 [Schistocerca gregaria]